MVYEMDGDVDSCSSALNFVLWLVACLGCITPWNRVSSICWVRSWMGPNISPDDVEKGEISVLAGNSSPIPWTSSSLLVTTD
jgi:hypothetical protein